MNQMLKTCECEYSVPIYILHYYYTNLTYINKEMGNILLHHVNENHWDRFPQPLNNMVMNKGQIVIYRATHYDTHCKKKNRQCTF